jgi:hypothetical protein
MTIFSCSEKDRAFPEFGDSDVQTGGFPRLVEGVFGDLDFEHPNDSDSSSLSFVVEFYDNNNGRDVASYTWFAQYGDDFPRTQVKSWSAGDFTTNSDGLPQLSATITFDEIFNALGMTIDDFLLTTDFFLTAELAMNDGRVFDFNNTGSNVIGQPTFQALFSYTPAVTKKPCNSILAGTYNASIEVTNQMAGIGWDGCDGNTWEGTVRIEAEHDPTTFDAGSYVIYSTEPATMIENEDASFGIYRGCYTINDMGTNLPLGDLRITESCGKMGFAGSSQWGEVWTFVKVEVDGPNLTLGMTNDYGEGGEVTLERTDGTTWQTDLFCEGC